MNHHNQNNNNHENDNEKKSLIVSPKHRQKTGELMSLSTPGKQIYDNPAVAYLVSLGSKRSRQTMKSFLNIVAKMLGYQNLQVCIWGAIRRHHIQAVMEMLADSGKAPATINTYLSALKGVALEAWTMKQLDTDNFQHIKQVRSVRGNRLPKGRALERYEIKTLFFTCENDVSTKGVRDAAIIGVLLGCGLRRAEIVALDMKHIIRREQALRVMGKGNKERLSYMPEGTWERLNRWIDEVRGDHAGPLFTRIRRHDDVTDNRLTDQAIYHILEIRRIESELEKFAPHDLRRTFASAMLDNGEDIVTVKDAMGHSSIITTQKYDRRGDERLKNAARNLDF
ncbi:integrase [Xenorhabdus sp. 12]|uniref:Integrase n=1 Tax=Xenorhabdus santafensis TaxID=2582833 RepID=A0ABU4SCX9_9GAMM|nr:integrase [Xenorhabdus sp. 12]